MDIKKIFMGFGILVILIVLYRYFFTDPTINSLVSTGSAKSKVVKQANELTGNAESADFTYSVWIFVKDWSYKLGEKKSIIKRVGTGGTEVCPEIRLSESKNNLEIVMQVYSNTGGSSGEASQLSEICQVSNIPLQKWTHVLVSTNNRALDTYIDGKLVKTCLLEGPPKINGQAPITVCGAETGSDKNGFEGYVAKVKYYSRTLNPREVYEIYKEGFSNSFFGSLFNRYRLRFSYLKDNQEVGAIEI